MLETIRSAITTPAATWWAYIVDHYMVMLYTNPYMPAVIAGWFN